MNVNNKILMARSKSKNYLSYRKAQQYMREEAPDITTRAQYLRWHKVHKPGFLPTWPHRVYPDFSWNDFLGTTNSFEKTILNRKGKIRHYRPMWEAVRYAQAQAKLFSLSTREQWEQFYDEYEVPSDIPKRPHHAYENFVGFPVWLGLDARAKVKTAVEGVVAIVGIHHVVGQAENVVEMRVWQGGYTAMRDVMLGDENIGRCYRAYEVDNENVLVFVKRKLEQHGHKRDVGYIVPNVNALMWDLMDLKIVKGG